MKLTTNEMKALLEAMASKDPRTVLMGARLDGGTCTATDGKVLLEIRPGTEDEPVTPVSQPVTISRKDIQVALKLAQMTDKESVDFDASGDEKEQTVTTVVNGTSRVTPAIVGKYPDASKLYPNTFVAEGCFNADILMRALKAAKHLSGKGECLVMLSFTGNPYKPWLLTTEAKNVRFCVMPVNGIERMKAVRDFGKEPEQDGEQDSQQDSQQDGNA